MRRLLLFIGVAKKEKKEKKKKYISKDCLRVRARVHAFLEVPIS